MRGVRLACTLAIAVAVSVLPGVGVAGAAPRDEVSGARAVPAPAGVTGLVPSDASLSADGRWVAFVGEVGGVSGLYRHDTVANVTEKVPTERGGELVGTFADPSISADGRWIAYTLSGGPASQVYLTDLLTESTRLVSGNYDWEPGDGASAEPEISDDGRYVTFTTRATDVINQPDFGAGSAPGSDVVVAERADEGFLVTLLSTGEDGVDFGSPSINADGSRVALTRARAGVDDVLLAERSDGSSVVTLRDVARGDTPSLSADASAVALVRPQEVPGGQLRAATFVHSLTGAGEIQVDLDPDGERLRGDSSAPRTSHDGTETLVARTRPGLGTDLFLRNIPTGTTQVIADKVDVDAGFDLSSDGDQVVHVSGGTLWFTDRGQLPAVVIEAPTALWAPLVWRAPQPARGKGYVLQVEPAGWEPMRATRIDRQWLRNGRAIPGATGLTYEITAADIGRELAVRERLIVPGVPRGEVISRAYKVKPDRSVLKTPQRLREVRGKKFVLRVRVTTRPGGETYFRGTVAPQGKVRVRLGKRSAVATVGRDGWVRLALRAPRPGKYRIRVIHRGTAYATAASPKSVKLLVRRAR